MESAPIIYIYNGVSNFLLRIPKPKKGATKIERDTFDRAVVELQGEYIRFSPKGLPSKPMSQFITTNPDVIKILEKLRKGKPIRVDLSLLPVKCVGCGLEFGPRSDETEDLLASHVASGECPGMKPDADDSEGDAK